MKMTKGIRLAFLTAMVSGISIFVNKFGVGIVQSPVLYTTLKNTMVGGVILSLILFRKKSNEIRLLKGNEWMKLISIGIIGGSIPFYLFFEGLTQTTAINAAMIHKTLFLWVALLAYPLLKEKLTKNQFLAVVMLYISNLVVGGFSGFNIDRGELMVLIATVLWAVENVIAKKTLKTVSAEVVTLFRMGLGSVVLWGLTLYKKIPVIEQISRLSWSQVSVLLLVSLFLLVYVRTWYRALKAEKAIVVSSVLVSSTLVTNIFASVFITHNFTSQMFLQMLIITFGVYVFVREEKRLLSASI